jgi:hypothetical protein
MKKEELLKVQGGASGVSATMLNAIARCVDVLYNLGRALGTGIRMVSGKKYC